MKNFIAIISVDEEKVRGEMNEHETKDAIYQAFGCLEDAGIALWKLKEKTT